MRTVFLASLLLWGAAGCRRAEIEEVVARVGKAAITEAEFQRKLTEVSPSYQNYVLTPNGRRQFLDVLIREKLILEAARADGVSQSPEFKERMEQLRKEEEEKLAEARDYMLARLWIDHLRREGTIRVTDDEVRDYHRKFPTEVSARHVLLPTPEAATAVIAKARGGGASRFAQLAQKESLDADTASQGGAMRPALMGEIIPELELLFKMRVGEVAGPVRSKFGYHVLLKEAERPVPFDQAQERIRSILEKQKLDRHLMSLQNQYPVEVVDAQFR